MREAFEWMVGSPLPPPSGGELHRGDDDRIAALLASAERMDAFGMSDALGMPSVRRSIDLIVSIGATFQPWAYQDGVRTEPPSMLVKPDPFRSRYDFTALTIRSLLEDGNAYWRLGDGYAIVLDPADVMVSGDLLQPVYTYEGQELRPGSDILHVRIGQRPGKNEGTSPIEDCLEYLAILHAQELYAKAFYQANGTPHTILSTDQRLTPSESKALRDAYVAARGESGVATLSQGFRADFPTMSPENAQLQDSRDFANTEVARLLGIPAPLLHVNLTGSAIYYQNITGVVSSLARSTIMPLYLTPIENALSELVGTTVRFSVMELHRVDVGERVDIYEQLMGMGVLSAEQVAHALGLDPANTAESTISPAPGRAQ